MLKFQTILSAFLCQNTQNKAPPMVYSRTPVVANQSSRTGDINPSVSAQSGIGMPKYLSSKEIYADKSRSFAISSNRAVRCGLRPSGPLPTPSINNHRIVKVDLRHKSSVRSKKSFSQSRLKREVSVLLQANEIYNRHIKRSISFSGTCLSKYSDGGIFDDIKNSVARPIAGYCWAMLSPGI